MALLLMNLFIEDRNDNGYGQYDMVAFDELKVLWVLSALRLGVVMLKHLAGKEEVLGVLAGNLVVAFVGALVNPEVGFWAVLWTLIKAQVGIW